MRLASVGSVIICYTTAPLHQGVMADMAAAPLGCPPFLLTKRTRLSDESLRCPGAWQPAGEARRGSCGSCHVRGLGATPPASCRPCWDADTTPGWAAAAGPPGAGTQAKEWEVVTQERLGSGPASPFRGQPERSPSSMLCPLVRFSPFRNKFLEAGIT